jgi:uncharacterized protein (DUF4415 family)
MRSSKSTKRSDSRRKTARGVSRSSGKAGKGKLRAAGSGVAGWSKLKRPDWKNAKIADFYRPLKKPVTLRLDADVIAWFKKDGRRYQTRINAALRKVMEREMKASA